MLSWFLNMRIKTKVGLSFLLVTLILLVVVLGIISLVRDVESTSHRVGHLRSPTAQASLMMLNGMNHSLASLRAWVILGEEEFKTERADAWKNQIEPSLATMQELSAEWTDANNVNLLKKIGEDIKKFRSYQKNIEDIAQTEENKPARKIMFEEVAPLEKIVLANLTRVIKLELRHKQTPDRRGLAGVMADLETSTSLAIEKIEEYMLSGSPVFKTQFEHHWSRNNKLYVELSSRKTQLSPEQQTALVRMSEARDKMAPLLQRILVIRSSEKWNKANYMLKTKAAPVAAAITSRLNEMLISQNSLLKADLDSVSRQVHFLVVILVGWFIAGGLLSGVLGATITRGISVPLEAMTRIAEELGKGNFRHEQVESITKDELGVLVSRMNTLTENLKQFRRHATSLLSGNLKVQEFELEGDYRKILEGMLDLAKKKKDDS